MATSAGDRTNFIRIGYAIIDKITPILRCILKKDIPPDKIQSKVTTKKVHINPDQKPVVQNSSNVPDYEEFDITLLYILIRKLCKVKEPTLTWGDCDLLNKGHIRVEDDIERIRIIRNKVFGHTAKISISQNDFETYWSILEGVYSRLGPQFLPNYDITDFIKVKTCPIDEEMEEKMKKIEIELQDRVDNLEERIVDVEACEDVLNQNVEKLEMKMEKMEIEHVESDRRLDRIESEMRRMQSQGEFRSTTDMKTSNSDKTPLKFEQVVMQPGNTQESDLHVGETKENSDEHSNLCSDEEEDEEIERGLNLRPYQMELTEVATQGQNTIVFAETGAGKTRIAYYIIREHLKANSHGRVAFLANHQFLVDQQFAVLKRLLPEYKETSMKLTGQSMKRMELHLLVDSHHILVMTPQLIVNTIESKNNIHMLSEFSLVIFDECHHTFKDNVYNRLMTFYHMDKAENYPRLPQIVGLTATFGTDKAKDIDDAKRHIKQIMANLNVIQLSVVKRNIDSYDPYTRRISTDIRRLAVNPSKDKSNEAIEKAIRKTEDLIEKSAGYFTYDSEERALQDAFGRIPDLKNSPAYIQWVVNLQNTCVPLLKNSERAKAVQMYCEYLKIYSEILEINESIRGKYALQGLTNRLEREHLDKLCGVHLFDISVAIAQDLQRELTWLSSQQSAPKKDVDYLVDIVKKRTAENKNTSIIIFVKTREMCMLLAEYLKSEGLEFRSFTGHTSGSEGHGTTPEKQLSILSDFKEGKIKGIISTTIAEEGLDIQGCDCVILYKFVGNEISSKQAKGRIRERQGNCLLLGRQQHIMRDSLNLQRFVLMEHGLKQILNMQHTDLELEIKQLQHEIVLGEQRRREQIASQVKEESDLYALVCKRCVKNDIDCSKIRVIKGSHHVVIDRNIRNRIVTTPLKKSLNVDDCEAQSQWFHDECKYKQGTVFLYKGVSLPALSQSRFLYYHKNDPKKTTKDFKRWTDLPFEFKEIREDDLSEMM